MKILFKFATRSRPEKFKKCVENIRSMVADKNNYLIVVSADTDDESMKNIEIENDNLDIVFFFGQSLSKIHAVNRDIDHFKEAQWDILINTSDDMHFVQKGFDDIIRQDMAANFPDTDGVLHYNDGNQKSNVMTLSILGRKYYDRFGFIYHPDYTSLWSDVEATEVAYMMGKYKYMGDDKILFRHFHPAWGLAQYDEQYRQTESQELWVKDKAVIDSHRETIYGLAHDQIVNPFKYPQL